MEHNFYTDKNTLEQVYKIISDHEISLTEDDIFNFLRIKNRWPVEYYWKQPTIEIITEYGGGYSIFDSSGRFLFDEWKKYYDSGFTSIISNVLDLTPELRKLSEKIFQFLGIEISANFYFTKGSTNHRISFPHHSHNYHVIVKPIYGKSKWVLGEKSFIPEQSFIVPAWTQHSVCECKEKKLSMTINLPMDKFQHYEP